MPNLEFKIENLKRLKGMSDENAVGKQNGSHGRTGPQAWSVEEIVRIHQDAKRRSPLSPEWFAIWKLIFSRTKRQNTWGRGLG